MSKILTTEAFIEKAKGVHGDTYDYSKTIVVGAKMKSIITCRVHGDFLQTPSNHYSGFGCKKCATQGNIDNSKGSTEDFIVKANIVHNNKYTYQNTKYVRSRFDVLVTCKYHGDFKISPNNHLRGKGCPKCALTKRGWNRSLFTGVPTSIYYAIINDRYYKVGITKIGERHRYYPDRAYGNKIKILHESWFFDGSMAYDLEKEMLLLIKDCKTNKDILVQGGNTEIHNINMLDVLISRIKELNEIN